MASQQLDELMLQGNEQDKDLYEQEKEQRRRQVEEIKKRLRAFNGLVETPGWQLFTDQMRQDLSAALSDMEKADNPTTVAKASAAYCVMKRLSEFVRDEIGMLQQTLGSIE